MPIAGQSWRARRHRPPSHASAWRRMSPRSDSPLHPALRNMRGGARAASATRPSGARRLPVRREGTLHRIGRFVVLASALACASGSGTQLTDSWHEPSTTQLGFNRTLVVFMSPNASARQMVEDRLASRIPNAVPAYRAIPDLNQGDPAAARRQLQGQGFDGIVAMRVVAVQQGAGEYVPGNNWYATPRD